MVILLCSFQVVAISVVGALIILVLIGLGVLIFCLWKVKGKNKERQQQQLEPESPVTNFHDNVAISQFHIDADTTTGVPQPEADDQPETAGSETTHQPNGTGQATATAPKTSNNGHGGGLAVNSLPQVTAPAAVSRHRRGDRFSSRIPQYSLKHGRRSSLGVNVWVRPQNPLIHSVIQNYLDQQGKTTEDVHHTVIQEVEIVPTKVDYVERAAGIAQPVPSPVSPENKTRPMTFMPPELQEGQATSCQFDASEGMHVDEMIGSQGGQLKLFGVGLTFPPGAVSTITRITLGILWGSDYKPELKNSEALLSPVVTCGPHGLSLKKAAVLQIPHCAHKINTEWKINVLKSETSPFERPNWQCLDASSDVTQPDIGDTHVTLHLQHFTLHTVTGEADQAGKVPAKIINLVAFAPPLHAEEDFKIRVYCVDDYSEESKRFLVSWVGMFENAYV